MIVTEDELIQVFVHHLHQCCFVMKLNFPYKQHKAIYKRNNNLITQLSYNKIK